MENHFVYEICVIVATLMFVAIGIYLIKTLRAITVSLTHVNLNLSKIESRIEPLGNQAIRLMENSNEIAESVQEKLSDLDPLMGSISDVGSALKNVTSSLNQGPTSYKFFKSTKKKSWQDTITDVIQLASIGVMAWQKIKKEK